MKAIQKIKKIVSNACIYYTTASLVLYTAGMIASGIEREWIPTLKMMYAVLLFSLLFSSANELLLHSTLPAVLRVPFHYAVTTLCFYVMFIVWGGYNSSGASVLVILLAYTLIYAAAFLLLYFFHYIHSLHQNSVSEYNSQFTKQK